MRLRKDGAPGFVVGWGFVEWGWDDVLVEKRVSPLRCASVEMTDLGLGEENGSRLRREYPPYRDETAKGLGTRICATADSLRE